MAVINIIVRGRDQATGPLNTITGALKKMGIIAGGLTFYRIFDRIGQSIRNVVGEAVGAASEFQLLDLRYQGLIAREMSALNTTEAFANMLGETGDVAQWKIDQFVSLRDQYDMLRGEMQRLIETGMDEGSYYEYIQGAIGDYAERIAMAIPNFADLEEWQQRAALGSLQMTDALEMAIGPAEDLLNWAKITAVTTPFTVASINRATSLGMAMGFTADQSKELTVATGNFTAGMGLTDEVMERILYNFGQMIQQGKVAGTELRDLARGGFVPVTDVLRRMQENLDMGHLSLDAFRKLAGKGEVDVREFFKAFIEMATEDFPGAMERMAMTWQGVSSNIHDFIQAIIGANILGPVVERFTQRAAAGLQSLLSPEFITDTEVLGETLGSAFDRAMAGAEVLAEALSRLLGVFGISGPTMSGFNMGIHDLGNAFYDVSAAIADVANWISSVLEPAFAEIGRVIDDVKETIKPFTDAVSSFLEENAEDIQLFLGNWGKLLLTVTATKGLVSIVQFVGGAIAAALGLINWPIVLITGAIALLKTAWDQNWGGIRDKLSEVWEGTIRPTLETLINWFQTDLPEAIEGVGAFFSDLSERLGEGVGQASEVWGGFKEKLSEVAESIETGIGAALERLNEIWLAIQPTVETVFNFFSTVVMPALQTLGSIIGNVVVWALSNLHELFLAIWPTIQQVAQTVGTILNTVFAALGNIIVGVILPVLQDLWTMFNEHILPVINTAIEILGRLVSVFTTIAKGVIEQLVLPILDALWGFTRDRILPVFEGFAEVIGAIYGVASTLFLGLLQNIVIPIIRTVWSWIRNRLNTAFDVLGTILETIVLPAIEGVHDFVKNNLNRILKWLRERILEPLLETFDKIGGSIDGVTGFLKDLAARISNIKLPDWLTPGSATPFEIGLMGINEQLGEFRKGLGGLYRETSRMNRIALSAMVDDTARSIEPMPSGTFGGGKITRIGDVTFIIYDAQDPTEVKNQIMRELRLHGIIA